MMRILPHIRNVFFRVAAQASVTIVIAVLLSVIDYDTRGSIETDLTFRMVLNFVSAGLATIATLLVFCSPKKNCSWMKRVKLKDWVVSFEILLVIYSWAVFFIFLGFEGTDGESPNLKRFSSTTELVFLVILPQVLNYLQGTGRAGSKLYKPVEQDEVTQGGQDEESTNMVEKNNVPFGPPPGYDDGTKKEGYCCFARGHYSTIIVLLVTCAGFSITYEASLISFDGSSESLFHLIWPLTIGVHAYLVWIETGWLAPDRESSLMDKKKYAVFLLVPTVKEFINMGFVVVVLSNVGYVMSVSGGDPNDKYQLIANPIRVVILAWCLPWLSSKNSDKFMSGRDGDAIGNSANMLLSNFIVSKPTFN
jgi:hypothetical protein